MRSSVVTANPRVADALIEDESLVVDLFDGRVIAAPLAWFLRLPNGTPTQRANREVAGSGYGSHRPDLDEDISAQGLLRGAPSAERRAG